MISRFQALTGCGVLVNTSFNVRGEPIVCTPEDAYRCFMSTEMDYLAVGDYVMIKAEQPVARATKPGAASSIWTRCALARPDRIELRNFGLILGALFAAFFGVLPMLRHCPRSTSGRGAWLAFCGSWLCFSHPC